MVTLDQMVSAADTQASTSNPMEQSAHSQAPSAYLSGGNPVIFIVGAVGLFIIAALGIHWLEERKRRKHGGK